MKSKEENEIVKKTILEIFAALAIIIMAMPFMIALNGFVLMKLWLWFIVPLGVPALTLFHSLGIATFAGFLKLGLANQADLKMLKENNSSPMMMTIGTLGGVVIAVLFSLGLGYFIHLLM